MSERLRLEVEAWLRARGLLVVRRPAPAPADSLRRQIAALLRDDARGPAGARGARRAVRGATSIGYPVARAAAPYPPAHGGGHGILIWPSSTAAPFGWGGASPTALALSLADVDTLAARGEARPYVAVSQADGVWGAARDLADGHLVGGRYWYDPAYPEVVLSWAGHRIFLGRSVLCGAPPIAEGIAAQVVCACIAREEGGLARLRVVCQDSVVRDYRLDLATSEVGDPVSMPPAWWVSTEPGCAWDLGAWPPDPAVVPPGFTAPYQCGGTTYRWADEWASWADLIAEALGGAGWVEVPHPATALIGGAWSPGGADLSLWYAGSYTSAASGYATSDAAAPLWVSHVSLGLVASTTHRSPCVYSDTTVVEGVATTRTRRLAVPCCGGWDEMGVHHEYAVRVEWSSLARSEWSDFEVYSCVLIPAWQPHPEGPHEDWYACQSIGLPATDDAPIIELCAALLRDGSTQWDEIVLMASADRQAKRASGLALRQEPGLVVDVENRFWSWGGVEPWDPVHGTLDFCALAESGAATAGWEEMFWFNADFRDQQRAMITRECAWICATARGRGAAWRAAWWPRGGMAPEWGGVVRSVGVGAGRDLALLAGSGGPGVVATGTTTGDATVGSYDAARTYWGLTGSDARLLRYAYEMLVGGVAEAVQAPGGGICAATRGVVGRSLLSSIPGLVTLVGLGGVMGGSAGADELSEGGPGIGLG